MSWIFNRREITRAQHPRLIFEGPYEKWKHLENSIEFLIISTEEFIVFVDKDIDVDWSLRDDSAKDDLGQIPEFNSALNRAATLETTPCDEIPPRMKLHFKRLIGEGIARPPARFLKAAKAILSNAEEYIQARSQETSRYWYLS